jgi:predicted MFS family arabinose efflux permease
MTDRSKTEARIIALSGMAALAVAMGIGRFAFTPILPMMQEDAGLTVTEGAWLAAANYAGYLAGALSAIRMQIRPQLAVRFGMTVISAATLGMAFDCGFATWLILRALPGVASAWILVFVSAWSLERLAGIGRTDLSGMVYAGVGVGIVAAGAVCAGLLNVSSTSRAAWTILGLGSLAVTALLWNTLARDAPAPATPARSQERPTAAVPEFWRFVLCQGALGFGYIIPATFLPLMAKQLVADQSVFAWTWPVFGAAAVASTLLAARAAGSMGERAVWIIGNTVMAVGVVVPIAVPNLPGIMIAALCVGGTFMVVTMAGMQEARRVGGANARMLMAAMTSAFAVGQIGGPLLVSLLANLEHGLDYALVAAALALLLAAFALYRKPQHRDARNAAQSHTH